MSKVILHIITKLQLGGAQQNTLYTLRNLDSPYYGFLVAGCGGELYEKAKREKGYKFRVCPFLVRKINPVFDILAFFWLFFYILALKPAVVHTHSSKAGILGRWAASLAGAGKIVHTFHGFGFTPLQPEPVRKIFILIEKFTALITDMLLTVAYANITKALSAGIGKPQKYRVIRSGIDPEKFEKKAKFDTIKKELNLKAHDRLVGNISCFKPQKGLFDYLKVCNIVSRQYPDCYFIIAGDGALRGALEKKIKEYGLGKRVFLLGWRSDIEKIMTGIDLLLHTAYFEGLPRVFLEAFAAGIPIVATEVDGAVDVIKEGKNGYMAPAGDTDRLAKYTLKLLKNENLRKEMSVNAKKLFKKEYDIRHMSKNLNKLYIEITKGEKNE
ncbi:MAG: glycosyltransferase family 4 protein [Elusimicrobia bacterium]|jgi:glycosyltransferase involved in cell wall biosynthesis|nr:glycosyltransferase family 4 protein [Elusimicrobiota bacterium]